MLENLGNWFKNLFNRNKKATEKVLQLVIDTYKPALLTLIDDAYREIENESIQGLSHITQPGFARDILKRVFKKQEFPDAVEMVMSGVLAQIALDFVGDTVVDVLFNIRKEFDRAKKRVLEWRVKL